MHGFWTEWLWRNAISDARAARSGQVAQPGSSGASGISGPKGEAKSALPLSSRLIRICLGIGDGDIHRQ